MPLLIERIKPDTIRQIAGSALTTSYQVIGSAITHPTRIIKFTNTCNVDCSISWDGTNLNEYVPAGSFLLLDLTANTITTSQCVIPIGTTIYAKSTGSGTGVLYMSTYYAY